MLKEMLVKLGLSEKEAHIYEAALESGPETAQKIARRAGITRTATYIYIKSLIKKGLMSSNTRDKKTFFMILSRSVEIIERTFYKPLSFFPIPFFYKICFGIVLSFLLIRRFFQFLFAQ